MLSDNFEHDLLLPYERYYDILKEIKVSVKFIKNLDIFTCQTMITVQILPLPMLRLLSSKAQVCKDC